MPASKFRINVRHCEHSFSGIIANARYLSCQLPGILAYLLFFLNFINKHSYTDNTSSKTLNQFAVDRA